MNNILRTALGLTSASVMVMAAACHRVGHEEIVARGKGIQISAADVEKRIAGRLLALRTQEHQLREQAALELSDEALLDREAAARGTSVHDLLQKEVDEAVSVTEAEVQVAYEKAKDRAAEKSEPLLKGKIEAQFRDREQRRLREQLLAGLRAKAGLEVLLEPPRAAIALGNDPTKGGGKDAPVTIIEFSDFECPYCARVNPTLGRVLETYGDRVRIAFRHFPLSFHNNAPKAAEAAICAGEQGKFWEMHDQLFDNQKKLRVDDLKQYAAGLGLDRNAFAQCLDSDKHAASWKRDLEEGSRYGVKGTPALFINGRFVSGAQRYETIARVIDDELARRGVRPPSPSGS